MIRRPPNSPLFPSTTLFRSLNIRARSGCTDATVIDAMTGTSRSIVRTWAMRGTLHMLAARDVHWLVMLLGPCFTAKYRRARLRSEEHTSELQSLAYLVCRLL